MKKVFEFIMLGLFLGIGITSKTIAFSWDNFWLTPDQRGKESMKNGEYQKASQIFQRKDWRATANYRAKNYKKASEEFLDLKTEFGYYNAGNSLAEIRCLSKSNRSL